MRGSVGRAAMRGGDPLAEGPPRFAAAKPTCVGPGAVLGEEVVCAEHAVLDLIPGGGTVAGAHTPTCARMLRPWHACQGLGSRRQRRRTACRAHGVKTSIARPHAALIRLPCIAAPCCCRCLQGGHYVQGPRLQTGTQKGTQALRTYIDAGNICSCRNSPTHSNGMLVAS